MPGRTRFRGRVVRRACCRSVEGLVVVDVGGRRSGVVSGWVLCEIRVSPAAGFENLSQAWEPNERDERHWGRERAGEAQATPRGEVLI